MIQRKVEKRYGKAKHSSEREPWAIIICGFTDMQWTPRCEIASGMKRSDTLLHWKIILAQNPYRGPTSSSNAAER
jgi:hypothetical protein